MYQPQLTASINGRFFTKFGGKKSRINFSPVARMFSGWQNGTELVIRKGISKRLEVLSKTISINHFSVKIWSVL